MILAIFLFLAGAACIAYVIHRLRKTPRPTFVAPPHVEPSEPWPRYEVKVPSSSCKESGTLTGVLGDDGWPGAFRPPPSGPLPTPESRYRREEVRERVIEHHHHDHGSSGADLLTGMLIGQAISSPQPTVIHETKVEVVHDRAPEPEVVPTENHAWWETESPAPAPEPDVSSGQDTYSSPGPSDSDYSSGQDSYTSSDTSDSGYSGGSDSYGSSGGDDGGGSSDSY